MNDPRTVPARKRRSAAWWLLAIPVLFVGSACCAGFIDAISGPNPTARTTPTPSAAASSTVVQQAGRETSPTPTPVASSAKPTPSETTDKRYATCAEANEHDKGPYIEDVDPEYEWYTDRDADGIVCEPPDTGGPDVDVPNGDDGGESRFCRRKWWC